MELTKNDTDVMSPEGIEERVKASVYARITLTGGGKYRAYFGVDGELNSIGVFPDHEQATARVAQTLTAFGSFQIDPKATLNALLGKESES